MTERQLIEEHITELAEIVGEARKLTQQEYEGWKNSVLDSATEKKQRIYRACIISGRTMLDG